MPRGRNIAKVVKKGTGGRPTKAETENRNSRIIAVATELFLSKGYSETSLENIASQAGVAKRTIYDWYGDKAAIFSAIIRSDAARIAPETVLPAATAASALSTLLRLAIRMRDVLLDPLTRSILRLMAGESQKFPDIIATNSVEGVQDMHDIVASSLSDLRRRKLLDFEDAELQTLASRYFDVVVGITSLRGMMEDSFTGPTDDELRVRVEMYLAYHQPAAPAKKTKKATACFCLTRQPIAIPRSSTILTT